MSEENKDQNKEGGQELILGKFKTQDDLIASYKQLEQKLHSKPPQQEPAKPPSPPQDDYEWQKKNAALDAKEAVIRQRKDEAAEVLNSGDTLSSVRRALGSADAVAQFQKEFDAGDVSASEVKRLAALGGGVKESTKTIPEPAQEQKTEVSDSDLAYYFTQLKNPTSAYNNTFSPEHKQVRSKVHEIRQRLGM